MDSLWSLVKRLEPGDYLAWQAENGKPVDRTWPKRIENVDDRGNYLRVEAQGQGDGKYHFTLDTDENCQSFYHPPDQDEPEPMGAIVFAELTDSDEFVTVKSGYYDSRQKRD